MVTPRFTTIRNCRRHGLSRRARCAQLINESRADGRAPAGPRRGAEHAARVTGTLLRDLLADPVDDVRLLAYGMLDGKEQEPSRRASGLRAP